MNFNSDIKEIQLSQNALKVLRSRYLRTNNNGAIIETPTELFRRVAKAVASAELVWNTIFEYEKWQEKFYEVMSSLSFLPNSPTLMNAGTALNQLSACFVLPVEDNLDAIFTTLKHAALIQQSGGGTGFNFSKLRPRNDIISLTGGLASGPVSFMKVFNEATEHIKYGGKRRGANMGILNINHPDIEEFISAKKEEGVLNNFNISAGITDAFMYAVQKNEKWKLIHPGKSTVVKTVDAKKLWNAIVENAWQSGDPGLIFLNTINEKNPLPALGKIESTNPCGEVPLLPYESCNLGSINLSKFITTDKKIDWDKLEIVIETAIRFLDNVIEINHYLLPEIKNIVQSNRKIGLGVMGWADLLIQLEIPYDSSGAIQLIHELMKFIRDKSYAASAKLAQQRGAFPNWNKSITYPPEPLRNATCLSIAPTGTISIIANTSSSIEPLFAVAYERKNILQQDVLPEINEYFIQYLQENNLYSDALIEEVKATGNLSTIKALPQHVKNIFKTALEIEPLWHLQHQVAFQQYVDNAVSKTINLPENATIADVNFIYTEAWKQKAKGITIFRYNSKNKQVLEKGISRSADACKVCVA